MDIERRLELIARPPTEEIVTTDELRQLFETGEQIIAYNGWEPSGMVHLGTGLICAYKMKDFIEAGIHFKAFLATWHAWINKKLGGNLEMIRKAADHFKHAWIALGVPADKVEFVYADELYKDSDYWKLVLQISQELTIDRVKRTLEIMGRKEIEAKRVADLIYTPMQVADIFFMNVKIAQLGMDQRKANMVAREIGPKLGFWKPVSVHHHLLQGLAKPPVWPIPDEQKAEILSSVKMSKSLPNTAIFIYDEPEVIKKKILGAFAPEKEIRFNPILDIVKYIIFREYPSITIERPLKYGGTIEYHSYSELEKDYMEGKLHPFDLKNAVAEYLIKILEPARRYFNNNKDALNTLLALKNATITR